MKSSNGNEIGQFVSTIHNMITGRYDGFDVNIGKSYISIKIETNHLSDEELTTFTDTINNSVWKDRFVQINNRYGFRSSIGYRFEKVLFRFTLN